MGKTTTPRAPARARHLRIGPISAAAARGDRPSWKATDAAFAAGLASFRIDRHVGKSRIGLSLASLLSLAAALATAQTSQPERTPERIQQQLGTEGEALESSRQRIVPSGPAVSYDDILRNPDDVALNIRFVQQRVAQGDLKSAVTTLERIMLLAPATAEIRLLYAIVLFRLDNLQEAERELRAIAPADLAPESRVEARRYLDEIAKRSTTTRVTYSLGTGLEYDGNRNAFPRQKFNLVGDVPFQATPHRKSDFSQLFLGTVGVRHDLGHQDGHELVFNGVGYAANQVEIDTQDLGALSLEGGAALKLADGFSLSPLLTHSRVRLDYQPYMHASGAKLRADWTPIRTVDLYASAWAQTQTFLATSSAATAPTRSGGRYDIEMGGAWSIAPSHRIGASLVLTRKAAQETYNAYGGHEASINHLWLLGDGQFVATSASIGTDSYIEPDTSIASFSRRDDNRRYRTGYTLPLGNLFGWAGADAASSLEGVTLTFSAEHFTARSNVPNYDYSNLRLQTLLVKRF